MTAPVLEATSRTPPPARSMQGPLPACGALLALLSVSCSGDDGGDRELDTRAVVIGIDSADWTVIDPMIGAGELPHFASLMARGVRGDLETVSDIPLSPVIWTSVATGRTAEDHGITWFLVDQPDGSRVPVRSTNRKVEAIWNIADRAGLGVASVGWWATYPAEPLQHGLIVSDALGFHGFGSTARGDRDEGKVHPPDWFTRMDALVPVEQQIQAPFARRFMDLTPEDYEAERFDPSRSRLRQPFNPVQLFQQYAVTAQGYTAIAESLLKEDTFELCLVYYEQLDSFSHLFMKYDPPKLPWVDERGFARYQRVVREWYRYQDELLGRLLAEIDLDRTAVLVVSDHGFKTGDRRIRSEQVVDVKKAHLDHEREGIFLAAGPHIRRGARIDGASVLDVTPTLLHYLGLPVGKDMAGKVLSDTFEPVFVQRHPIRYVTTHETGTRRGDGVVLPSDGTSGEIEAGLRALGYLGADPAVDGAATNTGAPAQSSPELHNNMGRIKLANGELDAAQREFERALVLDPRNAEALLNIGQVHLAAGRTDLAQRAAERALQVDPNSVGALAQLAEVRRDLGELDVAIRLYGQALALDDSQPRLFLGLGDALQRAGRYEAAEQAFVRTLQLDPDSFQAHYNLGVTYTQLGRTEDAVLHYTTALEKGDRHPLSAFAWNNLGALHADASRLDEALAAYERAAAASPAHLESRFNAAMIRVERGDMVEAVTLLEQAAQIAPTHELVQTQLGLAYLRAERVEEAFRSLLLVRRLYPTNWTATIGLAALRAAEGNADEARALLDEAVARGGDDARAFAAGFPALSPR